MQYNVKIDAFEGPLDLLLHLINHLEIDIYDIPMAEITEQYLNYIHTMKELQLDVASEFLVMAATLLAIKSKMLLPVHDSEVLEEDFSLETEEDPREELVEQLIEYRKYKEVAQSFKALEKERSLMFTKPPSDMTEYAKDVELTQPASLNVSLYDMIGALQKLLRRKKIQKPMLTKITRQEIPIEQRMNDIMQTIKQTKKQVRFDELFPIPNKEYVVVTFLAVLELMKRREISVIQEDNFADIFVSATVEGVGDNGHR